MRDYRLRRLADEDVYASDVSFEDDTAAILYALPLASGGLLEVWRGESLIAMVDERPSVPELQRAS